MQRIYIDRGLDPHPARASLTGIQPPAVAGVLGLGLNLKVVFFKNAESEALANSSTGRFIVKKKGARNEDALFQDITMDSEGSGAATVYKFSGRLLSDKLIDAIGEEESVTLVACVLWTEPTKDEDGCLDFEFVVWNSAARDGDSIPATTDARYAWIKDALVAGDNITLTPNDGDKTIEIEASGGGAVSSVAGRTGDVTLAKADVGLGNVDNTSDANKPVSTATQTALNAKAPLASPALTGTPTAPTASGGTSNTQIATTAFVAALAATKMEGGNNLSELASPSNARSNLGLGSVDNTSDANKPVSTATQTALNAKVPTTRAISATGLASGGGSLSADRTIDVPAASQAEAEAGADNTKAMTPLRVAQAIAALGGGGGSPISTPHVIYVEADGNDGTGEIGNPAKPFATGTAAYDAGCGASAFFVLQFGVGIFTIQLTADYSGFCCCIRGKGASYNISNSATVVQLLGVREDVENSTGQNSWNVNVEPQIDACYIAIDVSGGKVTASDGGVYTGGNGGAVSLRGRGTVSIITNGGGDSLSSFDGTVNSGAPGAITLNGDFLVASDGNLQAKDGTTFNTVQTTGGAAVTADGVDFRIAGSVDNGSGGMTLGRCAVTSGAFLFTDKGGNAQW